MKRQRKKMKMQIYKVCVQLDYRSIEGYYTKLENAIELVNEFMTEECHRYCATYDFDRIEEKDDSIWFYYHVHTEHSKSNEKRILGIKKVMLNE